MKRRISTLTLSATLTACTGAPEPFFEDTSAPAAAAVDWTRVDSALGRSGTMQDGDVYRYSMPRGDMRVTAAGVAIRPAFALGSWIAFKAHGEGAVATGDLVLKAEEMGPVIARLQQSGIDQTAIHHHIVQETPRVLYVHLHGHGDPVTIATAVREALALTSTPPPSPPAPPPTEPFGIDTAAIATALGRGGRINGGVLQVSVPRAETIRSGGMVVPPTMGLATAINFQPTGNGRAAITGDYVLLGSEVNPVIRTLVENGITVTSLHSHMLDEEPRLFFMHFWANADAVALARGLRAALDRTNSARSRG